MKLTKLQGIRMAANEKIVQFVNRIQNLITELSAAAHMDSTLEKNRELLRGLREEYHIVARVPRTTGTSLDKAAAQLTIHESKLEDESLLKKYEPLVNPQMHSKGKRKGRKCFHCNRKGHIADFCRFNVESKNYKKEKCRKKKR